MASLALPEQAPCPLSLPVLPWVFCVSHRVPLSEMGEREKEGGRKKTTLTHLRRPRWIAATEPPAVWCRAEPPRLGRPRRRFHPACHPSSQARARHAQSDCHLRPVQVWQRLPAQTVKGRLTADDRPTRLEAVQVLQWSCVSSAESSSGNILEAEMRDLVFVKRVPVTVSQMALLDLEIFPVLYIPEQTVLCSYSKAVD